MGAVVLYVPTDRESEDQWADMYVLSIHESWSQIIEKLTSIVQIVKVLGEGGFSFVYLAQDETSGVGYRDALLSKHSQLYGFSGNSP